MLSKVTEWKMTEEERLAYIAKHPIKPREKEVKVKLPQDYPDWKWRNKKYLDNSRRARYGSSE